MIRHLRHLRATFASPTRQRGSNSCRWTLRRFRYIDGPEQELPEAGWLNGSEAPGSLRWWDGATWTEQTKPANSAPSSEPQASTWSVERKVALGSGTIAAIGALGPWATVDTFFGSITVNGSSGDGVIGLVLAAVAALLVVIRKDIAATVFFILVTGLGAYHVVNTSRLANEAGDVSASVSPAWGLIAMLLAGLAGMWATDRCRRESSPAA